MKISADHHINKAQGSFRLFLPRPVSYNKYLIILCLLFNIINPVHAENSDSEKRWAEQLRDNIVIGDPVDLPFFALYTAHTTAQQKGAVILMHGTGAHPDWGDIIHPLRIELPDKGWATLSIQLPLLLPDKKDAESKVQVIESSAARIDTAIKFLNSKGYKKIVLIAHSFGSLMALNYLQTDKDPFKITAAVIIGTPSSAKSAPLNSPAMIEKVKRPLLDLYGSEDLTSVMQSAKTRKAAASKAANKNYRQVETIGANHFYNGLDEELVIYISGWLNTQVSNTQVSNTQ